MTAAQPQPPSSPDAAGQPPVLEARGLQSGYGGHSVLAQVDMRLLPGEVLCLIGHNGAGKSTLLKTLFGLMAPLDGQVLLDGKPIQAEPRLLSAAGISMVPEGRGVFPELTVRETFQLGLWANGAPKAEHAERLDWVFGILPVLHKFYGQRCGTLSGGQQQIVSLGRSLLSRPRCLLLDEPSIGLAPKLFQDLMAPIRELQQHQSMSILIVEQNVHEALKIADRVMVMKSGRIIREGLPTQFSTHADLMELY